jgi:predicted transcriptional regulator of viral defense system
MKYLEFREALKNKLVFTSNDIRKIDPGFHRRRLVEWQKAGHIVKIRNGYYCFADQEKSEQLLYYLANQLYKPSYISLSSALSFYNLIPEAVFNITSVGTLKTSSFETVYGRFDYRSLKPNLFFGYKLIKMNSLTFKIAEPEKIILDYCYLIKPDSILDFESLRINKEEIIQLFNFARFDSYLSVYKSTIVNRRANNFKSFLNA